MEILDLANFIVCIYTVKSADSESQETRKKKIILGFGGFPCSQYILFVGDHKIISF